MKKFLAGIAAAAIITVPMTSFALESMSKGALKKATGQAGVSIALDNVVIVQKSQPTTTYWDVDGTSSLYGTVGQVAGAGLRIAYTDAAQKLMVIDGILDNTKYGIGKLESTFGLAAKAATYGINQVGIVAAGAPMATTGTGASTVHLGDASNGDMLNKDTILTAAVAGVAIGDIITPAVTHAATAQDVTDGLAANVGDTVIDTPAVVATAATPAVAEVRASNYTTGISPLSIDVGTCQSLSAGLQWNMGTIALANGAAGKLDVAGVVIGLPTIEITTYHSADTKILTVESKSVAATANSGHTVPNISNELIRIEKSGTSQMAILGGRLEIAPH